MQQHMQQHMPAGAYEQQMGAHPNCNGQRGNEWMAMQVRERPQRVPTPMHTSASQRPCT